MKKFAFTAMLALAAGMIAMPVIAADDDGEKMFTVHGEIRSRWERLDNVTDLTDSDDATGDFRDGYSFLPYRARVSVHGQFTRNVEGVIEIQNFGTFGNSYPTKGFQDPTHQAFQDPNSVFNLNDATNNSGINLYQAYMRMNEVGGSKFYLQMGRQEQDYGKGLMIGNNEYYNGRSFDGLLFGWEADSWDVQVDAFTIEERNAQWFSTCTGGFGGPNGCRDDNVNMYNVRANIYIGDNGQVVSPYLMYYRDGAGTTGLNPTGIFGFKTNTLGVRYGKDVGMDSEALIDWNIEAAYQDGDIDVNGVDAAQKAWISEGWIGFNFHHGEESRSRVGAGYLITSGDDDPTDNETNVFKPLFADIHANNRLGNIDFGGEAALSGVIGAFSGFYDPDDTGITDVNIRYDGNYGPHGVLFALHYLMVTEDVNLGTDPSSDLGIMLDLAYSYTYTKNLAFLLEVSTFTPGGVFEDAITGPGSELEDMATRVAGQVRLRF